MTKKIFYNRTNTCDRCGKRFGETYGHPNREYDENGNWTGKWLCAGCKYKITTDRRTGCLAPNSEQAKGDMFEELTCKWRGVKNMNIISDCYNSFIDHTIDPELGIIQTKGKTYNSIEKSWQGGWQSRDKEFDNLILYCTSKDGKIIERIYIFPKFEVIKRASIHIYKNPSRGGKGKNYDPWYEEYRIKDEKILEKVNNIWKEINPKGWAC